MAKVSIVLPVLNGLELTKECIGYITDNTNRDLYNLIVIDDGSTDGTRSLTAKELNADIVIHSLINRGFGPSCNDGIAASLDLDSEYIVIFNNDFIVPPEWLETLLLEIESNEFVDFCGGKARLGMVGSVIVEPIGRGPNGYHLTFEDFKRLHFNGVDTSGKFIVNRKGGPWLFKTEVFKDVGLFDEQFVPGNWEETDLFIRMYMNGWAIACTEKTFAYHYAHVTMEREFDNYTALEDNRKRFISKWGVDIISHSAIFVERQWN